jgi:hypothetical protein
MKPEDVKPDGRVHSTRVKNKAVEYLAAGYSLRVLSENAITATGHTLVGEIVPDEPHLPTFQLRWDEKENCCNVDMLGSDGKAIRQFRKGTGGYRGHHAQIVDRDGEHVVVFDIAIHDRAIFRGEIWLSVGRVMALEPATFTASAKLLTRKIPHAD